MFLQRLLCPIGGVAPGECDPSCMRASVAEWLTSQWQRLWEELWIQGSVEQLKFGVVREATESCSSGQSSQ